MLTCAFGGFHCAFFTFAFLSEFFHLHLLGINSKYWWWCSARCRRSAAVTRTIILVRIRAAFRRIIEGLVDRVCMISHKAVAELPKLRRQLSRSLNRSPWALTALTTATTGPIRTCFAPRFFFACACDVTNAQVSEKRKKARNPFLILSEVIVIKIPRRNGLANWWRRSRFLAFLLTFGSIFRENFKSRFSRFCCK